MYRTIIIPVGDGRDKGLDIDGGGAALGARSVSALQTPSGFHQCFFLSHGNVGGEREIIHQLLGGSIDLCVPPELVLFLCNPLRGAHGDGLWHDRLQRKRIAHGIYTYIYTCKDIWLWSAYVCLQI